MRSASRKLIAARTPRNFASWLADAPQPRPTSTGLPRSLGFSTCSTDAKNASTSTCTMLGIVLEILRLEVLHIPSQDQADHGPFSDAGSVCGASGFGDGSKDPPLQLPLVPPDSDECDGSQDPPLPLPLVPPDSDECAGLKPRAPVSLSASVS